MLTDSTVLVTGASSGIGRSCAQAFASAGARLILCARRADRLAELASSLDTQVHTVTLDVRDRGAVEAALADLPEDWAVVDVLVNNAGLAAGFESLATGDPDDWDAMVDTNVKGLLYVTRAVLPGMVARRRGHVVNVGSVAGRDTYPNGAVYCATKAAVDRITKGMRMDVLGSGVKVSSIDPGMVQTEFSLVRFHGDDEQAGKVYAGVDPLTPDDVAETIVWMCSRPSHVLVADVTLFAAAQASATMVARVQE